MKCKIALVFSPLVNAEPSGRRVEGARLADHRFPCAQHQKSVIRHSAGEALKCGFACALCKIEQDIAAQDEVKPRARRWFGEDIVLLKAGDVPDMITDLPAGRSLFKVAQHLGDTEAALNFELTVKAGARSADRAVRDIGAQNINRPAVPALLLILKQHGKAVHLLPGGASRAPDGQSPGLRPAAGEFGQDILWNLIKGWFVAEEIGFVVKQRLDHFGGEIVVVTSASRLVQQADELINIADPVFTKDTGKRGSDTPSAAFGKVLPGAARQQVGNNLVGGLADVHRDQVGAVADWPAV